MKQKWKTVLPALAASLALVLSPSAQTAPAAPSKLEFEVASVKPKAPNSTSSNWGLHSGPGRGAAPGSRIDLSANLLRLIQTAYDLQPNQIVGEPKWVDSPEGDYEIVAKPPGPATDDQLRTMLQNLLADRFQLQVKIESREKPGYAVEIAKGGLKNLPPHAPTLDAYGRPFNYPQVGGPSVGDPDAASR